MFALRLSFLLTCVLASADSVILGRRRSWDNGWGSSWGTTRRSSSSGDPEKYRGWEGRSESRWGWWGQDNWGKVSRSENSWNSNSDWNNNNRWNNNNNNNRWGRNDRWNSWNNRRGLTRNRWGRSRNVHNTQRSRARSHSQVTTSGRSTTANSWYYQMICQNSYLPLMQSNGSPYYCSWYSPCPQNGGSSYWYSYKYRCTNNGEGNMGLCCVDSGEVVENRK